MYNYSRDTLNHMFASQFRTPESTLNSLQWTSAFNLQWNSQLGPNSLLEVRAALRGQSDDLQLERARPDAITN